MEFAEKHKEIINNRFRQGLLTQTKNAPTAMIEWLVKEKIPHSFFDDDEHYIVIGPHRKVSGYIKNCDHIREDIR